MKVNAYSFLTALKAVLPFAAKNDDRYYLNGVHLLGTEGGFVVEAADGPSAARVKVDGEIDGELDLVISRDGCEKMVKLRVPAKQRDSLELEINYSKSVVSVALDGQTLRVDTLDCKYVDTTRVLMPPSGGDPSTRRGFNACIMARAAKSASLLAHPTDRVAALVGTSGVRDNFVIEVPTAHGEFAHISETAVFVVSPICP